MNRFTVRELEKVRDLIPTYWDGETTHLVIPCVNAPKVDPYQIGSKYAIHLEGYIRNQPPNFTLSENWNQGTFPPEDFLDIEIVKVVGKMIGVKAIGKETRKEWEGWLPSKGFKIL